MDRMTSEATRVAIASTSLFILSFTVLLGWEGMQRSSFFVGHRIPKKGVPL